MSLGYEDCLDLSLFTFTFPGAKIDKKQTQWGMFWLINYV